MWILRNRWLSPCHHDAINILGLLICRPSLHLTSELINHERIHTRQMLEMLILPYYIWYITEWLIRLPMKGRAYERLCFEREAYDNMHDLNYLKHRKPFAWREYLLGTR